MIIHFAAPAVRAEEIREVASGYSFARNILTMNLNKMQKSETQHLLVQAKESEPRNTRLPTVAQAATQAASPQTDSPSTPEDTEAVGKAPEMLAGNPNIANPEKAARTNEGGYLAGGVALGLAPIPVESDFAGEGIVVDLFVDYDYSPGLRLRAGYNQANATLGDITLTTTAFYGAYRLPLELAAGFTGVALAGLAFMEGELASGPKSLKASTVGILLGAGVKTVFSNGFELGGQYQLMYGDADFDGVTLNLGSNQVLLVAAYRFR